MNESQISRMLDSVTAFNGELGFNTLGIRSFTFPNMLMAARFVDFLQLADVAWMEDDNDGSHPSRFNVPVTVQIDTNER